MNMHLDDAPMFPGEDIIAFGGFQLNRTRRALLRNGNRIALGCRAMEILLALTDKVGAIVSNRELLGRVWPNIIVEEATVRVHVALLRKVLGKAEPGSDHVHNITGRGYRFVAAVSRQLRSADAATALLLRRSDLPPLLMQVFGREEAFNAVAALVARHRFVTIAGAGGIGKSTVAIKVAEAVAAAENLDVCFVDLAANSLPEKLQRLSKRSTLLVLDSCEHVIDAATKFSDDVLRNYPSVNVLATSREPLRAAGEVTYELGPLELPATLYASSRQEMGSPAIQLFVDRARAYAGAEIIEDELPMVANICRRLGGSPLAIEIAAAQVRWLGVRSLCAGLHEAIYLSIEGRRTADRRHRTLRASFDWSYDLLSDDEQVVFRRLSVIDGKFSADQAAAVIAGEGLAHRIVPECLASLARKSLIAVDVTHPEAMYRLHELSRAYAREKLHQSQELLFRCFRSSSGAIHDHGAAKIANRFKRFPESSERYAT